jgi:GNAT superfamily N-acetyltransferase
MLPMGDRSESVFVRDAAASDFEAVAALLTELGRSPIGDDTRASFLETYQTQLADPTASHLVAEVDGRVVGFCSLHFRDRLNRIRREAWVPDLIVDPSARGLGAGRALLAEAFQRADRAGCWAITLESGEQRKIAHQLYRSMGMGEGLWFYFPLHPDT